MINRILNGEIKNVNTASLVIGFFTLLSALFGLLRNNLLASHFGAGDELDIYYAAFKIPDLVFNVIFFGAISAGFVPLFISELKNDESKAWEFVNNLLHIALAVSSAIIVALFFALPVLLPLIVPGYGEEKLAAAVALSRLLLIQPLFLGASSVFSGILQTFHKFVTYSLAPILYSGGVIVGIVALTPSFGIYGVGLGVILGAMLHFSLQLFVSFRSGFRYHFSFDTNIPNIKKIFSLMYHRSLNLVMNQANLIAVTFAASLVGSGSLAVFNLSNDLLNFIVVTFGTSTAIASFSTLARHAHEKNLDAVREMVQKIILQILFFLAPITAVFLLLREHVIRIVLGYGRFDWHDTLLTIDTFSILAVGILALGLVPFVIRVFFSFEDTRIPFLTSLVGFVLNAGLIYALIPSLGVIGIALAFTSANFANILLLLVLLERKIQWLRAKEFFRGLGEITLKTACALALGSAALALSRLLFDASRVQGLFLQAFATGVVFAGIYFLLNRSVILNVLRERKIPAQE